MNNWRFIGNKYCSITALQFAPTLTVHDPNPPLTLENPSAGGLQTIVFNSIVQSVVVGTLMLKQEIYPGDIVQGIFISAPSLESGLLLGNVAQTVSVNSPILTQEIYPVSVAQTVVAGTSLLELSVALNSISQGITVGQPVLELSIRFDGVVQVVSVASPTLELNIFFDSVPQGLVVGQLTLVQSISFDSLGQIVFPGSPALELSVQFVSVVQPTEIGTPTLFVEGGAGTQTISFDSVVQFVFVGTPILSVQTEPEPEPPLIRFGSGGGWVRPLKLKEEPEPPAQIISVPSVIVVTEVGSPTLMQDVLFVFPTFVGLRSERSDEIPPAAKAKVIHSIQPVVLSIQTIKMRSCSLKADYGIPRLRQELNVGELIALLEMIE